MQYLPSTKLKFLIRVKNLTSYLQ